MLPSASQLQKSSWPVWLPHRFNVTSYKYMLEMGTVTYCWKQTPMTSCRNEMMSAMVSKSLIDILNVLFKADITALENMEEGIK